MPERQFKTLLSCNNNDKYKIALLLAKMGRPAYQYMVHSLIHENIWVRECMAQALGEVGDENVIPHLIPLLKEDDEKIRFIVEATLWKIGSKKRFLYGKNMNYYSYSERWKQRIHHDD